MPKLADRHDLADPDVRAGLTCPRGKRFARFLDSGGNSLHYKVLPKGPPSFVYYARPYSGADAEEEVLGIEGPAMTPVKVAEIRVVAAKMEHIRKVEKLNPFVAAKRSADDLVTVRDLTEQYLPTLSGEALDNATQMFKPLLEKHGKTRLVEFLANELEEFLNQNHRHRVVSAMRLLDYLTAAYHCAGERKTPRMLPPGVLDKKGHCPTWKLKEDIPWIRDYRAGTLKVNWLDEEWTNLMEGFRRTYELASVSCINVLMLEAVCRTGARPGEMQKLRWNQVEDLKTRGKDGTTIYYQRVRLPIHKISRRNKKDRFIRLMPSASLVIERARAAGIAIGYLTGDPEKDKNKRVFFAPRKKERDLDKPPSLLGGIRTLQRYLPEPMPNLTAYNFRGGFVNVGSDELGPESEALMSEIIGHVDPTTMERYYRSRSESLLVGVVNAIDEKMPPSGDYSTQRPKMRITSGPRKNIRDDEPV